jgi:UDP-N-acetylglucosamine:LPS N-acetylglucosamine transferase
MKDAGCRRRVLAVASSGGHWAQLLRIMPALDSSEVTFVTVLESYRSQVPDQRFYRVNDANRWNKLGLVVLAAQVAVIVAKERPDVVISTGAAPGFFALWFGRMFGARTIWMDSVTNIDRLSMSGSLVGRYADLWLTQWPHLARPKGPQYAGAVL